MILELVFAAAVGYQALAILASLAFRAQKQENGNHNRPASILKPVRGVEPSMREAIASHVELEGEYEFLCGVRPGDPATSLIAQFPEARIVECRTKAPNGKVGVLIDLAREARNPVLVVNDADIRVGPGYLASVTAPLEDQRVGMVTCLYRAEGATFPARFEALGIATDFAPSTLVARLLGVDEFAMGSTMAFRRADLDRIGGFESISSYLADDYQLGRRIHSLGLKCVLSDVIVTTHMSGGWRDIWRHQLRWARTIRVSKTVGYLGLPVTFATVWAIVAAATGAYSWTVALLGSRLLMSLASGWFVLRSRDALRLLPVVPVRDLFGFAVWISGLAGNAVFWRGDRLQLDSQGRIA